MFNYLSGFDDRYLRSFVFLHTWKWKYPYELFQKGKTLQYSGANKLCALSEI